MSYTNLASIWRLDRDILEHAADRKYQATLDEADNTVNADLRKRRIDPTTVALEPTPTKATVTLVLTNTNVPDEEDEEAGEISIPEGSKFGIEGSGAPVYLTLEALTIPAGESVEVEAEAEFVGDVYNAAPGYIDYAVPTTTFDYTKITVTNETAATGGVNHPLQRLASFKAMEMILYDLFRTEMDALDYKRRIFKEKYQEEFDSLLASGVLVVSTGSTTQAVYGRYRLERG